MKKLLVSLMAFAFVSLSLQAAAPLLKIEQSVTIGWKAEANKFYTIHGTTNLTNPVWEVVEENLIGYGNVIERSMKKGGPAFFKVEEVAPNFAGWFLHGEQFGIIPNIHFEGSEITFTTFTNAVVGGSHFEDSFLENCDFTGANMEYVNFKDCTMNIVYFANAKCKGTYFGGNRIFSGDFTNADLTDVAFHGAVLMLCDFTGAKNLSLQDATFYTCIMPDGSIRNDP